MSYTQSKIDDCWSKGDLASATLVDAARLRTERSTGTESECPGVKAGRSTILLRSGSIDIVARFGWAVLPDGSVYLDGPLTCDD